MISIVQFFIAFFFAFSALVSASPIMIRDVYTPPVIEPSEGTVWHIGKTYTVTWDTSSPPAQITNPDGKIVLATFKNGQLREDYAHPLAQNFSILKGSMEVTVPNVELGHEYAIVLFGDSGNLSKNFTIQN